jgi:hypothetical protein
MDQGDGPGRPADRGDPEVPGPGALAEPRPSGPVAERPPEPPVVARLVIEIRSDGTTTIARGALEDTATGQRVGIEARGTTPLSLALELAKSMFRAPSLMSKMARGLLPGRRR